MRDGPPASREILRGASDGLLIAIREVNAREQLKRGMEPGDPDFAALAREVRIAAEAVLQLALEEEARARVTSGKPAGAGLPPINASPSGPSLAAILDDWREVERKLEAAEPASPAAMQLMEEFESLRDRYAQALDEVKRTSR